MVRTERPARRGEGRLVLCVDDDPLVLDAIERLLRSEPYELLTTGNPKTALEWIGQNRVDVLITDFKMPEMDGLDLIKSVEERSPQTSSLILTGFPEELPDPAMRGGARPRLIPKPWRDSELKEAIRALVPQEKPQNPARSRVESKVPFPNAQILVVERGGRFRSFLDQALTSDGFSLRGADSPAEALRMLRSDQGPVDLVLLDSESAGRPGRELLRVMRRVLPGLYIAVLADPLRRDEVLEWYALGAATTVPRALSRERWADFMRRAAVAARSSREAAQKVTLHEGRLAKQPFHARLFRSLRSILRPSEPGGKSERGRLLAIGIVSLLAGIGLAALCEELLEVPPPAQGVRDGAGGSMERSARSSPVDEIQRRWTQVQELELLRQMKDDARRFREEDLKERRWQGIRPSTDGELLR